MNDEAQHREPAGATARGSLRRALLAWLLLPLLVLVPLAASMVYALALRPALDSLDRALTDTAVALQQILESRDRHPTLPLSEQTTRALRGSAIGSFLGILPGGGPVIAQFAAYAVDKKFSKYKHEIGSGAIEGVAGQAAADEAAARTSFIPLMSIGIPENAVMALMMAAFIIKGIQPGPNMIIGHPDLFWGLVASIWVGNAFLLVLNVPLVRYWLSVFKIPYSVLFPSILFFCCIGTYSVNNNLDDIFITAAFGLAGYLFMRLDLDAAPLMLGFTLGPMLEENFRRALLVSCGEFGTFFTRPISGTLLALIGLFVVWQLAVFVVKTCESAARALGTAIADPSRS